MTRKERKRDRRRARKARGVTRKTKYRGITLSLRKLIKACDTEGAQRYRKRERVAQRKRRANRGSKEYFRV